MLCLLHNLWEFERKVYFYQFVRKVFFHELVIFQYTILSLLLKGENGKDVGSNSKKNDSTFFLHPH